MQNIILFIEPTETTYYLPSKIGHLFINRFAIDEEERSEILKIFELQDKIGRLASKKGRGRLNFFFLKLNYLKVLNGFVLAPFEMRY